jgi:hypothetical protein
MQMSINYYTEVHGRWCMFVIQSETQELPFFIWHNVSWKSLLVTAQKDDCYKTYPTQTNFLLIPNRFEASRSLPAGTRSAKTMTTLGLMLSGVLGKLETTRS